MKQRWAVALLLVLFCAFSGNAQSNRVIDALLGQKAAACAETAYLALVGGGWIQEGASPLEAFEFAAAKGWLPRGATPESPLDLGSFSLLAMRSFKLQGGVGWSIFRSKRYALRELGFRGIANLSGGSRRVPAGEEAVRMISLLADSARGPK